LSHSAANILAKQLEHLSDAVSGGVAMGARVPIVLMNRSDSQESRVASCALAARRVAQRDGCSLIRARRMTTGPAK